MHASTTLHELCRPSFSSPKSRRISPSGRPATGRSMNWFRAIRSATKASTAALALTSLAPTAMALTRLRLSAEASRPSARITDALANPLDAPPISSRILCHVS